MAFVALASASVHLVANRVGVVSRGTSRIVSVANDKRRRAFQEHSGFRTVSAGGAALAVGNADRIKLRRVGVKTGRARPAYGSIGDEWCTVELALFTARLFGHELSKRRGVTLGVLGGERMPCFPRVRALVCNLKCGSAEGATGATEVVHADLDIVIAGERNQIGLFKIAVVENTTGRGGAIVVNNRRGAKVIDPEDSAFAVFDLESVVTTSSDLEVTIKYN